MSIRCEDVELEWGAPTLSAEARAHLEGCAACRASAQVLSRAALPEVTAAERAALTGLAASALTALGREERRGQRLARAVGLAVAAGLGALVATGVMWRLRPDPLQPQRTALPAVVEPVFFEAPVLPDLAAAPAFDFAESEVSWEVSWPTVTEGDL